MENVDTAKAMELLKQLFDEISHLKKLNYDNKEFKPWQTRVKDLLHLAFDNDDYNKFTKAEWRADMQLMGDEVHQNNYLHNLAIRKTILQSILDKHAIIGMGTNSSEKIEGNGTIESPNGIFGNMHFHPVVIKASEKLFKDGHYSQAIFETYKAIEEVVKDKSGLVELFGKNLMTRAFDENQPRITVLESGKFDKDVQEGFKFLFMGASQGIRNPKAHRIIEQKDPYITLEYLGFASFLLKRIDGIHLPLEEN